MPILLPLLLAWALPQAAALSVPEGLWVHRDGATETVYQFSQGARGELEARVVEKTGFQAADRYFCKNAQFNGRPLMGVPWIWALKEEAPGLWSGGMAVDLRNDHGNLFYCRLRLSDDGTRLVLESLAGLGPDDRTLEMTRWTPMPKPSPQQNDQIQGNLMATLWTEDPLVVAEREHALPKPILDPVADRIVAAVAVQGTALLILGATVLSLLGR